MDARRIFIAGASGAIGSPLVTQLLDAGHEVHASYRSPASRARLEARGCRPHALDVFDRASVLRALDDLAPDCVIHQLTALPAEATPRAMAKGTRDTGELRERTVPIFAEAARRVGARLLVQSMTFVTVPEGDWIHDEAAPLWLDAPAPIASTNRAIAVAERATLDVGGLVLRYGFFYGPGTWYARDGAIGQMLARRMLPIVGRGEGMSSFVHVDDAARTTVAAIASGEGGVYNVCDDEPTRQRESMPELARMLGAKPPRHAPAFVVRWLAGPAAAHYGTTLRGASNAKARATWSVRPRSWRQGFAAEFA